MLTSRGIEPVIAARRGRKNPALHDEEKYKWRHLVENCFQKLEEFKRMAMRSDKTDESFSSMVDFAAVVTNAR